MLLFWPDTRNMPLEEIAAIFGDEDEVAIYQYELEIDPTTNTVRDHHGSPRNDADKVEAVETVEHPT